MTHRAMLWASAAALSLCAGAAYADDQAAPDQPAATPPPPAAAAPSTPPAATPAAPTLLPAMTGPLTVTANPSSFDLGPFGKKVYITGALTGLGLWQDNASASDARSRLDLSNGQIIVNKPDGVFQYFVQLGSYSLPSLGTPYVRASDQIPSTFGIVPQGFLKIAPNSNFSVEIGKLPTLVGADAGEERPDHGRRSAGAVAGARS